MDNDILPKDPAILLSYINTKLRDLYPDLDALCNDMHIDRQQLIDTMAKAGFEYTAEHNRFW